MVKERPKKTRTYVTVSKRIDKELYGHVLDVMDTLRESGDKADRAVASSETAFISYLIELGLDTAMHNGKMQQDVKS